ncbi:MAG: hypothetical protein IPP22_00900 [Nitrosomonas sp.]|nr:hypothetical protein [Nitrosomonas sp.]
MMTNTKLIVQNTIVSITRIEQTDFISLTGIAKVKNPNEPKDVVKEALIKLITFMVRQAHHECNQYVTVRHEPVEGLNQNFLKETLNNSSLSFRTQ